VKSADLLALFRADVDDVVAPYFWSDAEIVGYMDDAQKMFCRLVGGIRDATSDLTSIDIEVGEPFAALDPRILRITRMQRNSDAKPIDVLNIEDLDRAQVRLDGTVGLVSKAVIGMEAHTVRWLYVPALADSASMVVERLPLTTITPARSSALEIDEQHHRHLMLWMASLAFAKQDADTKNEGRAQLKESQFRAYCAAAKAETDRARHKTRVVSYGGL
jgi:hypothetical protein